MTTTMRPTTELEQDAFEFLNMLRESGVTNMFGAAPFLQHQFGLSKQEAKEVLLEWMNSYRSK